MIYTIDATGKRMGRLASEIALILQGKKHASYEPRLLGTDSVIVKNIAKMEVSGRKMEQKKYYSHTTQIGHLKERNLRMMWDKQPARKASRSVAGGGPAWVLRHAVLGMLPKNKLQAKRIKRLVIE